LNRKALTMQQPPSEGQSGTVEELRSDAKHIGSSAANFLHSEADARKGVVADQARSTSSAIQRVASELEEGAPTWLKSIFQQGGDQIQRLADTLEQKDTKQIADEVQSFARERPGMFLGACAVAGFAAARIFKAGADGPSANGSSLSAKAPSFPEEGAPTQLQSSAQGDLV
jgi:ElaB/YqjD/DUF883 family membrane-anchored ribosome-binding protein